MVSSSGFRVPGFGLWDSGFGFRVFGAGTCSAQRSKNLARGLSSTAVGCFSGSLLTSRFATWVRTGDFRLEGTGISLNVDPGLVDHLYVAHVIHLYVDRARKVDIRLPGKGNSNSHGARTVHQKHRWIRTSRLSIKNSLSLDHAYAHELQPACMWITAEHAQDPASEAASQ